MKKLLNIFCLCILAITSISCQPDKPERIEEQQMMDGDWEGTGEGRNGVILVRSHIEGHVIKAIRVVTQSESSFAQDCINAIIGKALEKQKVLSLEVDGVSGATLTSTGTIDAINMSILASMKKLSESRSVIRILPLT